MTKPLISVLILSYNHGQFIKDALDSISLNRSSEYELEIIVIDDGSTDESISILEAFQAEEILPIKLVKKKHEGVRAVARNFNELIALAKGKYISFLASDDSYTQNRFISQMSLMECNEEVVLCYANGVNVISGVKAGVVHPAREVALLCSHDSARLYQYVINNIPSLFIQSVLVRSDFVKSFKPFDDDLIADDWVFNIRVFKEISLRGLSFRFVSQVVFERNIHSENTSRNTRVHFERVCQVIQRYCNCEAGLLERAVFGSMLQCIRNKEFNDFSFYFKKLNLSAKLPFIAMSWMYSLAKNKFAKLFG